MAGWVKLHRELASKAIWTESTPEQKAILITLLMMANHQESEWEWQGVKYKAKPGEFVTSLNSILKKCGKGISIQNIRTALIRFEKYEFLTSKSTNKNRLISIINWELYQFNNSELASEPTSDQQATNKQLTTNKNDKNDKNDKNIYKGKNPQINYQQIVDNFNKMCASYSKVKSLSEARKKAINARLNIYTIEDFEKLFRLAEESDFLKGKNNKDWKATFDWLIKDSNMAKVLDGNYKNSKQTTKTKQTTNKFNQFPQRNYTETEMSEIEKKLLKRGLKYEC